MTLSRRRFLAAGGGTSRRSPSCRGASAEWQPSRAIPTRAFNLDDSFAKYRIALAKVERLATGMRWCEGPVWFGDGRYLLWSDIPNNRIMRWDEETGAVCVFRKPSQ